MTLTKIKLIKIFLLTLLLFNRNAFAEDPDCKLNGLWFDPAHGFNEYTFKQNGATFTGRSTIEDETCGIFVFHGTITANEINFDFAYTKPNDEECNYYGKVHAIFTGDCTILKGNLTSNEGKNELALNREPVKITSPAAGTEFVINTEPRMPALKATAQVYIPSSMTFLANSIIKNDPLPFTWKVKLKHRLRANKIVKGELKEVDTADGVYEPDFSQIGWPLGGKMTLTVQYYHAISDKKTYIVKGTNPGKALIEEMVTSNVLRHIACKESSYRQFKANREGGVGFPVVGENKQHYPIGGIGIFQAMNPDPEDREVWDWRNNVKYGQRLFQDKKRSALKMPITELFRLNEERKAQGLPLCPKASIPPLNDEQLEREALRRYNSGREYRWEPRDDKDCKGQWIIKPYIPEKTGAILSYVEDVLKCTI